MDGKQPCLELPTYFQQFVHLSRYARWVPGEERRETWCETVMRYLDFMCDHQCKGKIPPELKVELAHAITCLEVMPSMRCMMTAGEALRQSNVAAFNCCFLAIDHPCAFDEALFLLMNGAGVGFSVERQIICNLPSVAERLRPSNSIVVVEDSRQGWADGLHELISHLYAGSIPKWDLSKVRPAGARLKTFGGRASGPGPLDELFRFCVDVFKEATGRKLTSIECHDLMCKISDAVVVGGVRRAATISLSNPSDDRMRYAKSGEWWKTSPWRKLANNSAAWIDKPDAGLFLREWLSLFDSKSGERGIFNRSAARRKIERMGRRDPNHEWGLNPCLVGETLVSVADGRIHVPISVLAQEGKDVPVYCYSDQGRIVVRMMRNPRITGHDQPVFRITLDDGSSLRATANHKFRLSDGQYRQVSELKSGDSLKTKTRYLSSLKWIIDKDSRHGGYWWICDGQRQNRAEHRLVAEWHLGRTLEMGEVVHHKDKNGANNVPENLEVMGKDKHDAIHNGIMMGDSNPMRRAKTEWTPEKWEEYRRKQRVANGGSNNKNYSGFSHEEVRRHALDLTQRLGRRFTTSEWIEYAGAHHLPVSFQDWRRKELGSVLELSRWASERLGQQYHDTSPKAVKHWRSLVVQGYDAFIRNGQVYVRKACEICGKSFEVHGVRREVGVCSLSCSGSKVWKGHRDQILLSMAKEFERKREDARVRQMEVFTGLKFKIGRDPEKREWVAACRDAGISAEMCRDSSPFRYWKDLKAQASMFNHRVVSVVPDGVETVYSGTVDDFHNFFAGGFESKMEDGKPKYVYLNNANCGEIYLRSAGVCNLSEVVIRPDDTETTLRKKLRLATILGTMQATLTDFPYLRKTWRQNAEEEALLGVSLTGIMDNVLMSGGEGKKRLVETLDRMREYVVSVNKEWSSKLGINQAAAATCGKPSGTVSLLVDSASGIHPRYAPHFIRTVRADKKDPLAHMMVEMGFPHEDDVTSPEHNWVFSFPLMSPPGAKCSNDVSPVDMLDLWKVYHDHWAEHNMSCTVYIKENEWLDVGAWVFKHFDSVSGITFLPAGTGHSYRQAPYQEINEAEYKAAMSKMPENVDWSRLREFEKEETSNGHRELACAGGACDIADATKD